MYVQSQADLGQASTATAPGRSLLDLIRDAVRRGQESTAIRAAIAQGIKDESRLTNLVFFARHPELGGRPLQRHERTLIQEWLAIRDRVVRPMTRTLGPLAPRTLIRSSSSLRREWAEYACAKNRMVPMEILGRRTPVNPATREAFARLEKALLKSGYQATRAWNFNCRDIKGRPGQMSLHAFGLAIDIDAACNPHRRGAPGPARFSSGSTQTDRCRDVRARKADTVFTPEQIAAVEAIRTVDGLQVFAWGGRWRRSPDAMHFQINVSPQELRRGLSSGP